MGNALWQPIETAPRDAVIDLWHKLGFRLCEIWWDAENNCWSCALDDEDFSHWMPCPEPPKETP